MNQRKQCFNVLGQPVDCTLTENWLNAAGVYLATNGNGPTEAIVDLGNTGLHGFFGNLMLPPTPTERMQFIDDPAWKHWLKIALIVAIVVLIALNGYKLLK